MTADLLRRAAAEMRDQHGPEHVRHQFWYALARWLDHEAGWWQQADEAVAVARAYLGEPS